MSFTDNLVFLIDLRCISLDCGRKTENPERTYADTE